VTALSVIQGLLSRELGTTGWVLIQEPNGAARLRTQQGEIPFSTLKLLLEAIPEAFDDTCDEPGEYKLDAARKEGYDKGYSEGYDQGVCDGDEE